MIRLTVAIPTYNRNTKAANQVSAVLKQIQATEDPSIELLVLDNASDLPVEQTLCERELTDDLRIRIVRNPANIGLAANINRCFEHANGDWVWVLGDDDKLLSGSINTVLEKISESEANVVLHKFSNKRDVGPPPVEVSIENLEHLAELAGEPWFYSNLMFISTGVMRKEVYLKYLSTAYHWNGTIAPHLAVLFAASRDDWKSSVWKSEVVSAVSDDSTEHWNLIRLRMGIQTLMEIEGCETSVSKTMNLLMSRWYGGWKAPFIAPLLCMGSSRPKEFWRCWYFRAASSSKGFYTFSLLFCALFWIRVTTNPFINRIIVRTKGEKNDSDGISRS